VGGRWKLAPTAESSDRVVLLLWLEFAPAQHPWMDRPVFPGPSTRRDAARERARWRPGFGELRLETSSSSGAGEGESSTGGECDGGSCTVRFSEKMQMFNECSVELAVEKKLADPSVLVAGTTRFLPVSTSIQTPIVWAN
jgi:hypothetical protein